MKIRLIGGLIGLCIFVVAKVFFVDTEEVRVFNDKLVEISSRNGQEFSSLMGYLDQYAEGQSVDVQSMRASRDQLENEVRSNLEMLDSADIPDDELCRNFHKAVRDQVANSMAIIQKNNEQIEYIAAHNPGTRQDVEQVDAMLDDLFLKNDTLFASVESTQKQMADKHDLTLE